MSAAVDKTALDALILRHEIEQFFNHENELVCGAVNWNDATDENEPERGSNQPELTAPEPAETTRAFRYYLSNRSSTGSRRHDETM
jgi:hypothetical protein